MRKLNELLRWRVGLRTLTGEAQALRARLAREHAPSIRGASALTGAVLRLLPLLSAHLPFSEMAAQTFLSRNTIKSQANSIYRKLDTTTRSQAVSRRSRDLGLLDR
jgi:LuxR family transcriptional regulator, maltose regulon positive regulatory protein